MRHIIVFLTIFLTLAIAGNAQGVGIGSPVENFSLPDLDGKVQTLSGLKGQKGAVVVFLSAQCSAVKAYKDRINQIAAEAGERGIGFIGVNSNSNETVGGIKANAAEFGYKFPILIDKGNVLADRFHVLATPEVYFFDGENVLLYRGAIDNNRTGGIITENYLLAAFDASIAGKPIFSKTVMPTGCTIKRVGDVISNPKN